LVKKKFKERNASGDVRIKWDPSDNRLLQTRKIREPTKFNSDVKYYLEEKR
jgi:hypothetical protein